MLYLVELEGFEGQKIEVQPATLFRGSKLLVNGKSAEKGKLRHHLLLHRDDGTEVIAKWKPVAFNLDVPKLQVGEQIIELVEPLPRSDWAWSALPVLLIFVGGALGAICGMFGLSTNVKIFRSQQTKPLKYLFSLLISILSIALYLLIANLLAGFA